MLVYQDILDVKIFKIMFLFCLTTLALSPSPQTAQY